jgi:uncharacterized protein (DUF4415 family)
MPKPSLVSAQQILDLESMLLTSDVHAVEMVMVMLDRDVVDRYKDLGPDWKFRMQTVLEQASV